MTSADSKKPAEIELAYLLTGLRQRGLVVGPDDARKVVAVFAHAADWSQPRRLRALKSLLARSDEERRVIDELAPFLFVQAEKREAARPQESSQAMRPAPMGSLETRAGQRTDILPRRGAGTEEQRRAASGSRRKLRPQKKTVLRWGASVLTMLVLAAVVILLGPKTEAPIALPPIQGVVKPPLESLPPVMPTTSLECKLKDPPSLPIWPFILLLVVSLTPGGVYWYVRSRAIRQENNIKDTTASTGSRTFRLDLPPERDADPLPPDAVREATFHLSAPSATVTAPWLDPVETIEATARSAGHLSLRYAQWKEHRPVLFIEDVAPTMARWPNFGRQIAAGIAR